MYVQLYKDGFNAIADSPYASPPEKEFTKWGAAAASLDPGEDSSGQRRIVGYLMETLKDGKADLDLKALAAYVGSVIKNASPYSAKESIAATLKTIEISPFVTSDVKILARKVYTDCMAGPVTTDKVNAALKALTDLADPEVRHKEAQEEIRKTINTLNDSDDNKSVAVEKDFVDVDGIKLKRRVTAEEEKS